jgi:hypothetical protein
MAIAIEVGHYTLSKAIKTVLRANLDAALASIGVADYLPSDLQATGRNVYLSDDRIPPQSGQYLLINVEHTSDDRVMSLGTQNSLYTIRIKAAVRGMRQARSGTDPAPTYEDAAWQTAGVLARAADYVLERYLVKDSSAGCYNCRRVAVERQSPDPLRPNECAYIARFEAYIRTRNPLAES